jgi:hypothetical protein
MNRKLPFLILAVIGFVMLVLAIRYGQFGQILAKL